MLITYCQFYVKIQFLGRLYQRCDAKKCNCPKGREHHLNGTKFEIVRCEVLIFFYVILHTEIYLIQLIQTVTFDILATLVFTARIKSHAVFSIIAITAVATAKIAAINKASSALP